MAEIVNLRAARKAKQRAQKQTEASANRAAFGMTKADKTKRQTEKSRAERQLDGAKLERD